MNVAAPQWISVAERLPRHGDTVYVAVAGKKKSVRWAWYHKRERRWVNYYGDKEPTHWMPLPEPPK